MGEAPAPDEAAQVGLGDRAPLVAMSFSLAGLKEALGDEAVHFDAAALPFGGSARVFAGLSGGKQQGEQGERFTLQLWSRWSPAAVADAVELIRPDIERWLEP